MSAAATPADAGAAPAAPKKGKKKLIVIVAVAVLLLGAGGGAALYITKKKAAEAAAAAAAEDGDAEEAAPAHAAAAHVDPKHPPTFVPLDPFVVNLADKESERYAQIGITLEVDDAKFADSMKVFMPAIRNGILMVLAHKTSQELLQRSGKEALAEEILRESVRPMGIEIDAPEHDDEAAAATETKATKKKKKKKPAEHNPVQKVHFSNFIIQ